MQDYQISFKMTATELKLLFQKNNLKSFTIGTIAAFVNISLSILDCQQTKETISFEHLLYGTSRTLDIKAPFKQKYVRSDRSPIANEAVLKIIMDHSRL